MKRRMLDTNAVSQLLREHPTIARHVMSVPMVSLCISAITAGELHFGLAKRPDATRLHLAVTEFLRRVDVLPWEASTAETYGQIRARMEQQGRILAPLDMQIAAHALEVDATLITNDGAFSQVAGLEVEDWTS